MKPNANDSSRRFSGAVVMDPLMNARAKRMLGRIRFQKNVEAEEHKLRLVRERLEKVVEQAMQLQLVRMVRMDAQSGIEFNATVRLDERYAVLGKEVYYEAVKALQAVLWKKLSEGLWAATEEFNQRFGLS